MRIIEPSTKYVNGVSYIGVYTNNKNYSEKYPQFSLNVLQDNSVSFSGNYLIRFFRNKHARRQTAQKIVNKWSLSAATAAGVLANTGIGDTVALTYITKEMCKRIFRTYKMQGGYVAAISGVAAGTVTGGNLASKMLTVWPAAGNVANATVAYTLHQLTGRACIAFCEDVGVKSNISNVDAVSKFGIRLKNGLSIIQNEKIRELVSAAIDKAINIVL